MLLVFHGNQACVLELLGKEKISRQNRFAEYREKLKKWDWRKSDKVQKCCAETCYDRKTVNLNYFLRNYSNTAYSSL